MIIRKARDVDWPGIYAFYAPIMAEGETYAFPPGQSLEEARPWWMEPPPGQTVVALEDEVIVGSSKMGANRPGRGSHVATAAPSDNTSWAGAARPASKASSSTPSSRRTVPPYTYDSPWDARSSGG